MNVGVVWGGLENNHARKSFFDIGWAVSTTGVTDDVLVDELWSRQYWLTSGPSKIEIIVTMVC